MPRPRDGFPRVAFALGNPLRYRMVARLRRAPATPGQLAEELNRPLHVISRNLSFLLDVGLVGHPEGAGGWTYAVIGEKVGRLLDAAEECARAAREEEPDLRPYWERVWGRT